MGWMSLRQQASRTYAQWGSSCRRLQELPGYCVIHGASHNNCDAPGPPAAGQQWAVCPHGYAGAGPVGQGPVLCQVGCPPPLNSSS